MMAGRQSCPAGRKYSSEVETHAITSRYRLRERSPLIVTIMAMARGLVKR